MATPQYPQNLPTNVIKKIVEDSISWASANDFMVNDSETTSVHAPFALLPSPFPKHEFLKAKRLQPIFNALVDRVARDLQFIDSVVKTLAKSDQFTQKIYEVYIEAKTTQSIWIGIHRSDYMLHSDGAELRIKQVELNTIASSFSSLSSKISNLHRHNFDTLSKSNEIKFADSHLPMNSSGLSIASALAKAYKLYNAKNSIILMVVQPGEKNVFDQHDIANTLMRIHAISLVRITLTDIFTECRLEGSDKRLMMFPQTNKGAGYSPADYPSELEWDARLLIEKSFTIKCPNTAYHLAGSKKIQQVLAGPGILEKYLDPNHASQIRETFTGLYPLDQSSAGLQAYKNACDHPLRYVLKPQREGGAIGNNYYGTNISERLKSISETERNSYILMDLIKPPPLRNIMVRNGDANELEIISELGIYGCWISDGDICHLNEESGHLLRTKSVLSNEGGIAAGFSVLDSPFLV